jgi:hypothetical protein
MKMTLHATAEPPGCYHSLRRMMEEDNEDGKETTERKLMNIPSTNNRGCWHFGETVYTWTC